MYRLSVVVTANGDRELLPPSIRALAGSADAPPFEVVAVVRGDGEPPRPAPPAAPPLRIVRAPGGGLAAAYNRGAAAATGELLLFLDGHRHAHPSLLTTHDHHHHRQGAHVVVGPPGHATPSPGGAVAFEVAHLHGIHFRQTSIHREVFERLGGFDERFDRAEAARAGDADLGYRLLRAGYRVTFDPGRGQRHSAAATLRQSRECGQAAVALVRKHPELAAPLLGPDAHGSGRLLVAGRCGLAAPRLSGLAAAALARLAVRRAAPAEPGASAAELLEAARAASYWRGVAEAGGVPRTRPLRVLCYHAIADLDGDPVIEPYGVPPAQFRDQLDSLRRAGYRFIHPDELLAYLDGRAGLPRRPLLLTFDDCYTDLLDDALPELLERGIPAVAFAVSGRHSNLWDQAAGARALPLLDARGLEALARAGVEIGAHSRTHRSLSAIDPAELAGETAGVAADLERAGLARPRLFAYPHGDWSQAVLRELEQAGYAAAFTVTAGRVRRSSGRYTLPRVDVRRRHAGWRFRLRVALVAGGRLRRPARRLKRWLTRPGAGVVAAVPALASLASLADTPAVCWAWPPDHLR